MRNYSEEWLRDYQNKHGSKPGEKKPKEKKLTKAGNLEIEYRSKAEAYFVRDVLSIWIKTGEILRYDYEAMTLKIGERLRYTGDFFCPKPDGIIRVCEVKGTYIRPVADAKFKTAVRLFPEFDWHMWEYDSGVWRQIKREITG